jgi:hypothetical protein
MKKAFLICAIALISVLTGFSQVPSVTLDYTNLCEDTNPGAQATSYPTFEKYFFDWDAVSGGSFDYAQTNMTSGYSYLVGCEVSSGSSYFSYRVRAKGWDSSTGDWYPYWSDWEYGYIYPIPGVPDTPSGPNNPSRGVSVTYTTSAVDGATSYNWDISGGTFNIISGGTGTSITVQFTESYKTYCVKVEADGSQCDGDGFSSCKSVYPIM